MIKFLLRFVALVAVALTTIATHAQEPQSESGHAFAQANCASCHAIGRVGQSPLAKAPPFRMLHLRYPVEDLAESLAEGIKTSHPMPQFQLDEPEIENLLAYLKSLER